MKKEHEWCVHTNLEKDVWWRNTHQVFILQMLLTSPLIPTWVSYKRSSLGLPWRGCRHTCRSKSMQFEINSRSTEQIQWGSQCWYHEQNSSYTEWFIKVTTKKHGGKFTNRTTFGRRVPKDGTESVSVMVLYFDVEKRIKATTQIVKKENNYSPISHVKTCHPRYPTWTQ